MRWLFCIPFLAALDEPWVLTSYCRYLHADHQGSIIALSNSSGTVLNKLKYDSYGIPDTTNVERFGYTGQLWFKDLGLFHYKARMYSPKLGRFLQTDPIFYADQMNMYVGNDPMNATDPSGMAKLTLGFNVDAVVIAGGRLSANISFDTKNLALSASMGGGPRMGLAAGAALTGGISPSSSAPASNNLSSEVKVNAEIGLGPISVSQDIVSQGDDGQVNILGDSSAGVSKGLEGVDIKPATKVGLSFGVEFQGTASTSAVKDAVDNVKEIIDPYKNGN